MSTTKQILVIGGGYAGVKVALRLARKTKRQAVAITLVSGLDHFVERIRLHQLAAGQKLKKYLFRDFFRGTGVNFIQGWVTELDPEGRQVTVQTSGGPEQLGYDYLVYALGSTVETGRVPGVAEYGLSLGSEKTALALQQQLPEVAGRGGRLLVAGGGLTGIEAATEIAATYPDLEVVMVTRGRFGEDLSEEGARHIRQVFDRFGIKLIEHQTITRFSPTGAETADGTVIPFDLGLWAGAFAVSPLARQAGLPVNGLGQVVVDQHLRVPGRPEIYVAGDAASLEAALEIHIRMGCATAGPMGNYVADHLAAVLQGWPEPGPYRFWYFVRCISLGRHEALIQWVQSDDTPKSKITTGWLGARIKEFICRGTIWDLQIEQKLGTGFFSRGGAASQGWFTAGTAVR